MHEQLASIKADLESILAEVRRFESEYPVEAWSRRPAEASWSATECIAHLNLTTVGYLPRIDAALGRARQLGGRMRRRMRMDPVGWLIWRAVRPATRMKTRTSAPFEPVAARDRGEVVAEFARLKAEQISCIEAADGLPLHRVRIESPFAKGLTYSVYSALMIAAAHERRHLAQAERALAGSMAAVA